MMQFSILKSVVKKNAVWFIVLYSYIVCESLLYWINPISIERIVAEFLSLPSNSMSLIIMYKNLLLLYLVYFLYVFEINNNYIYIFNRISKKRWFVQKSLLLTVVTIIYEITYHLAVYLLLGKIITISVLNIVEVVAFDAVMVWICVIVANIYCVKKIAPLFIIVSMQVLYKLFNLSIFLFLLFILFNLAYLLIVKTKVLKKISY